MFKYHKDCIVIVVTIVYNKASIVVENTPCFFFDQILKDLFGASKRIKTYITVGTGNSA